MIKNIWSKIAAFVEWIIVLLLVVLIILTGFQRFSNEHNFFGFRVYVVASGSMIPTYNIGDTLLIKEMDASNIKKGDAVTYIGDDEGIDGMIITHQVQKVEIGEDGKYYFHTKGVANNIEDPIVSEDQVLGKVVYRFFLLSFIGRVTTSKLLLFCFVAIPIAILIAIEIIKLIYQKDDESDSDDELEDLNNEDNENTKIDSEKINLEKPVDKIDTDDEKDDIIEENSEEDNKEEK